MGKTKTVKNYGKFAKKYEKRAKNVKKCVFLYSNNSRFGVRIPKMGKTGPVSYGDLSAFEALLKCIKSANLVITTLKLIFNNGRYKSYKYGDGWAFL